MEVQNNTVTMIQKMRSATLPAPMSPASMRSGDRGAEEASCTWNPSGKPIARTIAPSDANALRHPTAPISAAAVGGSAIAPTAPTVINTAKAVPTALVKPRCQGA